MDVVSGGQEQTEEGYKMLKMIGRKLRKAATMLHQLGHAVIHRVHRSLRPHDFALVSRGLPNGEPGPWQFVRKRKPSRERRDPRLHDRAIPFRRSPGQ